MAKQGRPKKKKPIIKHDHSIEIAEQLDNSKLFNPHHISKHPEVKALVEHVFQQMEDEGKVPTQQKYRDHLRDHLRLTVLNLCVAYFSDPSKFVAYHRNKNQYRKGTRNYKLHLSYSQLVQKVIPFLLDNGYIENHKGVYFEDTKKISRMKATAKLMQLVQEEHNVTLPMITQDIEQHLVVLKDKKKVPGKRKPVKFEVPYEDTEETLRMKGNVKFINEVLDQNVILLEISNNELDYLNASLNYHPDPDKRRGGSLDFTQYHVHRVFNNGSFDQGGRFFGGWWQRIPREYRKHITINGRPTCEPDFSGLHINMLYAYEKQPMPEGDVYFLDGYSNDKDFRSFMKQLLLIMINASSRNDARAAIYESIYKKHEISLPAEIASTKAKDLFPVMDAFGKKHEPISKYFNSGVGVYLQNCDSQIAEWIMLQFAKSGAPCLPVHDSFIVDFEYEDVLIELMKKAFQAMFGVEPKIETKDKKADDMINAVIEEYQIRPDGTSEEQREKDKEWIEQNYSRYNQLLHDFAAVKDVDLTVPDYPAVFDLFPEIKKLLEQLKTNHELDEFKHNLIKIEFPIQ